MAKYHNFVFDGDSRRFLEKFEEKRWARRRGTRGSIVGVRKICATSAIKAALL